MTTREIFSVSMEVDNQFVAEAIALKVQAWYDRFMFLSILEPPQLMGRTGFIHKLAWHLIRYPDGLHPPFLKLLTLLLPIYLIRQELAPILGQMGLDLLADHLTCIFVPELQPDSIDARLIIFIDCCPSA